MLSWPELFFGDGVQAKVSELHHRATFLVRHVRASTFESGVGGHDCSIIAVGLVWSGISKTSMSRWDCAVSAGHGEAHEQT